MRRLMVVVASVAVLLLGVSAAVPASQGRRLIADRSTFGDACAPVWRDVPSPRLKDGRLEAVAALSLTEAWVVGGIVGWDQSAGSRIRPWFARAIALAPPLIEHWDGTRWSVVPTPRVIGVLYDVAVTSESDAWAVGRAGKRGYWGSDAARLLLHWNGLRWSRVTLPAAVRDINAISALATDDVWGVGGFWTGEDEVAEIAHWDGARWKRVFSRRGASLSGVTAISTRDVWAVGQSGYKALVMHWDGARWQTVVPKQRPRPEEWLSAVAGSSGDGVWAGGGFDDGTTTHPPTIWPTLFRWRELRSTLVGLPRVGETEFVAIAPGSRGEVFALSENLYTYIEDGGGSYLWHKADGKWRTEELTAGRTLSDVVAIPGESSAPALWAVGQIGTGREPLFPGHTVPLIRRFGC